MENSVKKIWNAREELVINEFVKKVRQTFKDRVQRIILYGSRARGDADEESDYDFLVLFDSLEPQDKKIIDEISWEVSYKYNIVLTAQAIKDAEFSEDRYFYFYENVRKEGIEL